MQPLTIEQIKTATLYLLKQEPRHLDWLNECLVLSGATTQQCDDSFNQLVKEKKIELSMFKVRLVEG